MVKDRILKNVIYNFRCGLESTIQSIFYFEDTLDIKKDIVDSLFLRVYLSGYAGAIRHIFICVLTTSKRILNILILFIYYNHIFFKKLDTQLLSNSNTKLNFEIIIILIDKGNGYR